MAFVHLHLHTIYSFLDGLTRPAQLMTEAKKLGMDTIAITDHGNMHGVIDFYTTAQKAKMKPIIGMEAYIAAGSRKERTQQDAFHLVLLARNNEGYRNLCRLSSQSNLDGFYYKPRIDRELLKDLAGGLIATSACLGGEIPRALMDGNKKKALAIAAEYRELFGRDNFFLELQVNGLKDQDEVNPLIMEIGKELGIPFVATNDVHYISSRHAEAQDILFCINEKKKVEDTDRMHHESREFYLKSEEEMRRLFTPLCIEAVDNTAAIAARCSVELELGKGYLPQYDTGGVPLADFLTANAKQGLEERFADGRIPKTMRDLYEQRLREEIEIIVGKGYPGYFLIVSDFIGWAKKNGVPVGPGRGSGAGSLVAYCTGITDIDPIRYGLFFERFLNPERPSMPDFDIDFCQQKRERVIEYVTQKYGVDHVAQIATFAKMKAKSAIRDVARVLGIDLSTADRLAKMVPDNFDILVRPQRFVDKLKGTDNGKVLEHLKSVYAISDEVAEDCDRLKEALGRLRIAPDDQAAVKALVFDIELYEKERAVIRGNNDYKRIIDIADQIEGLFRQTGKHAAGVVISDKPLWEYSPIFLDKDGARVTQYDKDMVEKAGLVKFDFLGLKTLTMVAHAVDLVRRKKPDFDISRIPLDDAATYKTLWTKSSKGVFQMDSAGFGKMMKQMRPDRITDLIAGVALYRPGPMASIPSYIRRKHGREDVSYDHPLLESILKETYGLIVYQEQVMQISVAMAGFSMGHADLLRKAMGKKQAEAMAKAEIDFREGAKKKQVDAGVAQRVFELMKKFAEYGFNKSHAAAYAVLGYQTAYLKTHYPHEFYSALISSESGDAAKVLEYISDARQSGIAIHPPDINRSELSFSIEAAAIRFGLGAVKNAGEGAIDEIITERQKNGPFKSLLDFTSRINQTKVNSRAMEFLIKAGAFDFTGINRGTLLAILPMALREGDKHFQDTASGQQSLFSLMAPAAKGPAADERDDKRIVRALDGKVENWDVFHTLTLERDVLGVYLSGHPASYFAREARNLGFEDIDEFLSAIEEAGGGPRTKVWLLGTVTTEIKPQKGRDGDYFLRGVIEGHNAAINFTINSIDSTTSPLIEKLKSPLPLAFRVSPRVVRNAEEGTIDRIEVSIDDLAKNVLTLTEYLTADPDRAARAVIDAPCEVIGAAKDIIKKLCTRSGVEEIEFPLAVKLCYPDKGGAAYLERNAWLSEERIRMLKDHFGPDRFYFVRRQGTGQ
ncbi:MAG TPA: DNA polymerase III subunit alpha [bacterium]|nr:DNA polymerase III subunit alpha [bacterium]